MAFEGMMKLEEELRTTPSASSKCTRCLGTLTRSWSAVGLEWWGLVQETVEALGSQTHFESWSGLRPTSSNNVVDCKAIVVSLDALLMRERVKVPSVNPRSDAECTTDWLGSPTRSLQVDRLPSQHLAHCCLAWEEEAAGWALDRWATQAQQLAASAVHNFRSRRELMLGDLQGSQASQSTQLPA
jgi:hypothetical protein